VVGPDRELMYASVAGTRLRATASSGRLTFEAALQEVQVDNPVAGAVHPVALAVPRPPPVWPAFHKTLATVTATVAGPPRKTAVTLRLAVWRRQPGGVVCVEEVDLAVAPLALAVEQEHALRLTHLLHAASHPFLSPHPREGRPAHEPGWDALAGRASRASAQQRKIYIEAGRLSAVDVSLTFLPTPYTQDGGHALGRVLGLAQVEGARMHLAPLAVRHPLLSTAALAQLVSRHYTRAALPQLFKLLASADVFGDPRRLLHHLNLGVWSFLAEPAAGLLSTARGGGLARLPEGVIAGSTALAANTLFAFSNAAAKLLHSWRRSLLLAGLDAPPRQPLLVAGGELPSSRRLLPRLTVPADGQAHGLFGALLNGVAGILSEPIRGIDEAGLPGLALGAWRGGTGALVRPLAAALEAGAHFAESVRSAVSGSGGTLLPRRPPRYVDPVRALQPYRWSEAAGRALLAQLHDGAYLPHGFLGCVPLAPRLSFIVATCRHLLHITSDNGQMRPVLHWACAAEDVLWTERTAPLFVALLALAPRPQAGGGAGWGARSERPSSPPTAPPITCPPWVPPKGQRRWWFTFQRHARQHRALRTALLFRGDGMRKRRQRV